MNDMFILTADLAGTVIFAVTGAVSGVRQKLDMLGVVVFSCTVGVGGGILRDMMSRKIPAVLVNDFYATASLIGGVVYVMLPKSNLTYFQIFIFVAALVSAIRLAAIYFKLQLPKAG